jgi:hypothetical protein
MEIPLNQKYTTADGRVFKTMYFIYVRDADENLVDGIRLVEDVPGKPLPVIHDRPLSEIKQIISDGRMVRLM